MSEQPFRLYRIQLAGHVDLGLVSARRDASGTFEIEDDGPTGRRFIGPAAIYMATEIKPSEPLPEPSIRLVVRIKGRRKVISFLSEDLILFRDGTWMKRSGWGRPDVDIYDGLDADTAPYSDDDIPF